MSKSRLEKFLYALYSLDSSDLPTPLSRIEELYKCLVTGDEAPTFEPLSRVEKYLMAILGVYDANELPNPISRVDVLLYKLATGDDNLDDVKSFLSEHEELLAEIIRNGGVGGNIDIEYVLYTLSREFNTLYNTAEKPVKSAILKGATTKEYIDNLFDGEVEPGVYAIDTGLKLDFDTRRRSVNKIKIEPSTTYTLSGITWYLQYDENENFLSSHEINNQRKTFTSKANAHYIAFYTIYSEADFFIGLGDVEPKHELVSVKMPVLTTIGKNLFDFDSFKKEENRVNTGKPYSSFEIKLKPNTKYSFNRFTNDGYGSTCYFAINTVQGDYIGNLAWLVHNDNQKINTQQGNFTTKNTGIVYISGIFTNDNLNKTFELIQNLIIVEGDIIPTSYEPYKSNILTVNEPIELRGIGNVQDELDLITGEVVQNIGDMVLDGSEDWFNPTTRDNLITFRLKKSFLTNAYQHNIPNDIICDKLPLTTPVKVWANNGYIPNSPMEISRGTNKDDGIDIIVDMDRMTEITNLVSFKQWLNNNHLTVQYQLAEKPIKTVDLTTVDQDGNNAELSTFNDITHVTLSSEGLIPEAELEVATKNEEDLEYSIVYTAHTLSEEHNTLYNTAKKPVKSAILKGQTLVNQSTTSELTFENVWQGKFIEGNALQSGKKYFASFDLESDNSELTIQARNGNSFVYHIHKGFTKGKNVLSFILEQDANGLRFQIGSDFNVKISNIIILEYQEGMENWDIPYFTGMQSVKLPVLTTTGKNLFDIEKVANINNWVCNKTSSTNPYNYYEFSLKPNTTYTFSRKSDIRADGIYAAFNTVYGVYNEGGGLIHPSNNGANKSTVSFTTDSNGKIFLNVYNIKSYLSTFISLIEEAQIEEGSTATPYEPYKSNILSTSGDIELRGIGEVKDELDLLTGEVTERIGEIVLDGSEGRWELAQDRTNTMRFNCYSLNIPHGINGSLLKTDKLPYQSPTIDEQEGAVMGGGNTPKVVSISIMKAKLPSSDIDGFKQWLSQNPITIQYQLATESIKTVDLSVVDQDGNNAELSTFNDITHVTLSSEGLIPEAELEVAEKVPEVAASMLTISREQEVINATTNEQSENVDATMIATTEIYEDLL